MIRNFLVIMLLSLSMSIAQTREIAITIDDLPVVTRVQDQDWQIEITDSLLKHLKKYDVPAAGFIIKNKVINSEGVNTFQLNLLKKWYAAGMELGNHTYSHKSLNKISSSEYISDIELGDEVFTQIEINFKPVLFRHPFLHTGRDSITRSAVNNYLSDNSYVIAPVSIDNADYIYARAYENAIRNNDENIRKQIASDYLSYMTRVVEYYENQSELLLGYEIKQILLLHANRLNADLFDELARMLVLRGYKFIPVKEALKDPAYALADNYFGAGGISWLHRWALTQGKRGEFFKGEPEVSEFVNKIATD